MEKVVVNVYSGIMHVSQILTGFYMLAKSGQYDISFVDKRSENKFPSFPYVEVIYNGKKLIYDLLDGYQYPDEIKSLLSDCDFYFKRSYSGEYNASKIIENINKMHPLGFNYHVTERGSLINEPFWKETLKIILGKETMNIFYPSVFEEKPVFKADDEEKNILFLTRVWGFGSGSTLSAALQQERKTIDEMRTEVCRKLIEKYKKNAFVGICDGTFAREYAPELIVPHKYTKRINYIKILHKSDVCIGTMGLHESIGWKTAEYVAAAKGIINERLHYEVPGDFELGKNYIEANTAKEILESVDILMNNPDMLFDMKNANYEYYQKYLRPDRLVDNTLKIVKNN